METLQRWCEYVFVGVLLLFYMRHRPSLGAPAAMDWLLLGAGFAMAALEITIAILTR